MGANNSFNNRIRLFSGYVACRVRDEGWLQKKKRKKDAKRQLRSGLFGETFRNNPVQKNVASDAVKKSPMRIGGGRTRNTADATRARHARVFCQSSERECFLSTVISNYHHKRHREQSRSWQLDLHCKVSRLSRPTCAISLNCAVAAGSSSERAKLVTKAPSRFFPPSCSIVFRDLIKVHAFHSQRALAPIQRNAHGSFGSVTTANVMSTSVTEKTAGHFIFTIDSLINSESIFHWQKLDQRTSVLTTS